MRFKWLERYDVKIAAAYSLKNKWNIELKEQALFNSKNNIYA